MKVIIENPFVSKRVENEIVPEIKMNLTRETTIAEIKEKVSEKTHIPAKYFDLIRPEEKMDPESSLKDSVRFRMVVDVPPRPFCMQIFIKMLSGKTKTFVALPDDTVALVKYFIYKLEGMPAYEQRLIFAGRQLEDDRTLKDYKVENECTLTVLIRMGGLNCETCHLKKSHRHV